jgi:hypothetical protein
MRAIMDAATDDAVRSTRYAHHYRDWQLHRGNPIARLVRRCLRALARRDRVARHKQPAILDPQARAS